MGVTPGTPRDEGISEEDLQAELAEFAEENLSDISGGDANSIFEGSISGGEA